MVARRARAIRWIDVDERLDRSGLFDGVKALEILLPLVRRSPSGLESSKSWNGIVGVNGIGGELFPLASCRTIDEVAVSR